MLDWVENLFHDVLTECLQAEWPYAPKIYNYRNQPVGTTWPDRVKYAHLRSRFLVAIWAPPYFYSSWCIAEWRSMCERADLCGTPTEHLLYPIKYSDGIFFPADAKAQLYSDFSDWALPPEIFKKTEQYVPFYKAVRKLAEELAGRLSSVPAWRADFPIVEPPPLLPPTIMLPSL
jgi:hypothetical protein